MLTRYEKLINSLILRQCTAREKCLSRGKLAATLRGRWSARGPVGLEICGEGVRPVAVPARSGPANPAKVRGQRRPVAVPARSGPADPAKVCGRRRPVAVPARSGPANPAKVCGRRRPVAVPARSGPADPAKVCGRRRPVAVPARHRPAPPCFSLPLLLNVKFQD